MSYLIKEIVSSERPRERMKKYGVASLSDEEVLAIIIGSGTKDIGVKELSSIIIKKSSGISNLASFSYKDLCSIKGIKESKALAIMAAIELGKRCMSFSSLSYQVHNSYDIYLYYKYKFKYVLEEEMDIVLLNTKNMIIKEELLFKGTINQSTVSGREIFKSAFINGAFSFIIIHNHPSGNPSPSNEDIIFTNKLSKMALFMEVKLIDHIIMGNNSYYSFKDGKITNEKN